jgi:hypothetical protein
VQLLDTGHFATETHVEEIAAAMLQFLATTDEASGGKSVTCAFLDNS